MTNQNQYWINQKLTAGLTMAPKGRQPDVDMGKIYKTYILIQTYK